MVRVGELIAGSHYDDAATTLLHRLHVSVIFVNLIAVGIDSYLGRYHNALIELFVFVALLVTLWRLNRYQRMQEAAYSFLVITSVALLGLIYLNHFATMSVIFVLLLPLTTLLFLRLRVTIITAAILFMAFAGLLYFESLTNPQNLLVQDYNALLNLLYALLIVYTFGILYHLSIMKTFDELDASNHQKALLLSEVHHRVKNNLNVIASIVGLHANMLTGREKEELVKSKSRIESIAMVHEMLYRCDDFEHVDFAVYTRRLGELLLGMFTDKERVRITVEAEAQLLPLDVMIQLGIIINELVTNSIKYAFKEGEGRIVIGLKRLDGCCILSYRDDGIGVEDTQRILKGKSLGIKLVHLAVRQLNATMQMKSENGLRYEIGFACG